MVKINSKSRQTKINITPPFAAGRANWELRKTTTIDAERINISRTNEIISVMSVKRTVKCLTGISGERELSGSTFGGLLLGLGNKGCGNQGNEANDGLEE